jgi:integrase
VQPSGSKSYAVRYRFRGLTRKLTIGPVLIEISRHKQATTPPTIGVPLALADARLLATDALRQVKGGIDPVARKRGSVASGMTVRAIAGEYLRRHVHLKSIKRVTYDAGLITGALGERMIGDVTRLEIVRMLDRVEEAHGAASADRVHAVWRAIANWHANRVDDYRPPVIRGKRDKNGARSRVLADDEIRRIWLAAEAMRPFGDLVRFLLLTAARRDEARRMRRSELVDGAAWVIPAERVKTKRDVLIPLSTAAATIVASMPRFAGSDLIFSVDGTRPIGGLSARKRVLDAASSVSNWRIHDLRRTARTLLSRAGVAPDIAEKCLGHAVGAIRAVYDRHEFEREKREAFGALAALVDRIVNA